MGVKVLVIWHHWVGIRIVFTVVLWVMVELVAEEDCLENLQPVLQALAIWIIHHIVQVMIGQLVGLEVQPILLDMHVPHHREVCHHLILRVGRDHMLNSLHNNNNDCQVVMSI